MIHHLYWGTNKENRQDAIACGAMNNKTVWQRMIDKYGIEKASKMQGEGNKSIAGKIGGSKSKSVEHKKHLSESTNKHG